MPRHKHRSSKTFRRLGNGVELLERREVMASAISAALTQSVLVIEGTPGNDSIRVRQMNGQISVEGVAGSWSAGQVTAIRVAALDGNDLVDLSSGLSGQQKLNVPAYVDGGLGDDSVVGTNAKDELVGGGGNDWLLGGLGSDILRGGAGTDRLFGQNADDTLLEGEMSAQVISTGISADGKIYVLRDDGVVERVGFGAIGTGIKSLGVAPDGVVYGLMQNQIVYRYAIGTNSWSSISGAEVTSLSVAANGAVYCLTSSKIVYRYTGMNNRWDAISGAEVTSLQVAADNNVYCLTTGKIVYRYSGTGNSWTAITGAEVTSFSIAANGTVYCLTAGKVVYRYSGSGNAWSAISGAEVISLSTTPDGGVFCLTQGKLVYRYNGAGNSWTPISGAEVITLTTTADGSLYCLTTGKIVYRYTGNSNIWNAISGAEVTSLGVSPDGGLYCLTVSKVAYRYTGISNAWNSLPLATTDGGRLTIRGSEGNDTITVSPLSAGRILVSGIAGSLSGEWSTAGITSIQIEGLGGDDTIVNQGGTVPVVAHGGVGNDRLAGSHALDALYGDEGSDLIEGSSGVDGIYVSNNVLYVIGTPGDDTLEFHRNNGRVIIRGHRPDLGLHTDLTRNWPTPTRVEVLGLNGNDTITNVSVLSPVIIKGGDGNDFLRGLNPTDGLYGEEGNDTLDGSAAFDILASNDGVLFAAGTPGNDILTVAQNDGYILLRGAGKEVTRKWAYKPLPGVTEVYRVEVSGLGGNDTITSIATEFGITARGGAGNDRLTGGDGDDRLAGGVGNDLLIGRLGNDTYVFEDEATPFEVDTIVELVGIANGIDTLEFSDVSRDLFVSLRVNGTISTESLRIINGIGGAFERVIGGSGNDVLHGSEQPDFLYGGDGNDTIYGYDSDDILLGGFGSDCLYGGQHNDVIDGGFGYDIICDTEGANLFFADLVIQAAQIRNGTAIVTTSADTVITGSSDTAKNVIVARSESAVGTSFEGGSPKVGPSDGAIVVTKTLKYVTAGTVIGGIIGGVIGTIAWGPGPGTAAGVLAGAKWGAFTGAAIGIGEGICDLIASIF
ncbi:Bifunctional hemolysin/adenylate cyclase precursor [Anatilimnocola aggregata]|uniref:Bifunctional hemolysin/adenylate cyclase n=1 Tax=Anatilimnocola aggregata TaxID=2528021 RepID=A0A517YMD0_9BACT|nr:tectonin domain-containing protein [Anatilimnocola aggregata]QDU31382.1 Bifunctional hemolysin/adenylate cyclase precursor [Anatilimnocola aggregata]